MNTIPPQPDCHLTGKQVVIRPLREADLRELASWQPHTDPLLGDYNLHFESLAGWRNWLRLRQQHRWSYAIRNLASVLVGHLSLRQIDPPHSSRLGITIAAGFVGQGYGRDALVAFLDYYFDELGFAEMRLDVSGANGRARHLYQDLGFRLLDTFWLSASVNEDWEAVADPDQRRHYRWGKVRFYEMRLEAREWRALWPYRR